tara:strand:- start:1500 stop:2375 length:876 start_codon:yes stop_codon:yes gene_type:complete
MENAHKMANLVKTRKVGKLIFDGTASFDDGSDTTYGGHLLAQASHSACQTVTDSGKRLHAITANFLQAGTSGKKYTYEVEILSDGKSFSRRNVRAFQENRLVLQLVASFCKEKDGLHFKAKSSPDFSSIPAPESLPTYDVLMRSLKKVPFREDWAFRQHGFDRRIINAPWTNNKLDLSGGIKMWVRADGYVDKLKNLHEALLIYQSDESLADNILVPFGLTWSSPEVFMVSLDHSMWIHQPVDVNDWLYIEQEPLIAIFERGLAKANVWNSKGVLISTFLQEALFRKRKTD